MNAKVLSLIAQLEKVLEDERPVNDLAPLGSGLRLVKVELNALSRTAASPAALKLKDLIAKILEHSPSSEGLKKYITEMAETKLIFQMSTQEILDPLRDPDLYDDAKVQNCELEWLKCAANTVSPTPTGFALMKELRQWSAHYARHYGVNPA